MKYLVKVRVSIKLDAVISLLEEESIKTHAKILGRYRLESPTHKQSRYNIPKDAITAVISQFDKINFDLKSILRVAAVAGIKNLKMLYKFSNLISFPSNLKDNISI